MQTVLVHPDKCVGCMQCEFACAVEHSTTHDPLRAWLEDPPPKPRIHVEAGPWLNTAFPATCRHCEPAPCVEVCPTAALGRDAEHDVVLVNDSKCIACATCAMVCPFDVVTFHLHGDGAVPALRAVKCDGCIDRRRHGAIPACVEACKTGALVFGEVNELVAAAREQRGKTVLLNVASSVQPTLPDTVVSWRSWGRNATAVARGVSDGSKSI